VQPDCRTGLDRTTGLTHAHTQPLNNAARVLTFMSNADFCQANNDDNKNSKTSNTVYYVYVCVTAAESGSMHVHTRTLGFLCNEYVGIVKPAAPSVSATM